MRAPHIDQLSLMTKHGPVPTNGTLPFMRLLGRQVFVIGERYKWVPRGSVFVWNRQRRIYFVYQGGVYDAIRGVRHAQVGYGLGGATAGELGEIRQLTVSRATLRALLRDNWHYVKLSESDREAFAERCLELVEEFALVRDDHKRQVRDKIKRASCVIDTLGRLNWTRRNPIFWSAVDELDHRVVNIRSISSWVDARQFALHAENDRALQVAYQIYQEMDGLLERGFDFDDLDVCASLVSEVMPLYDLLLGVWILPYDHGFARSAEDLNTVRKLLNLSTKSRRDRLDITRLFDRVQRSMALYSVRRSIEDVLWPLSREMQRRHHNPDLLDGYTKDLRALKDYLTSISDFDQVFRNPALPSVVLKTEAALVAAEAVDWKVAKNLLVEATRPF
ncbi:hypothetical protein KJ910_03340 [Patescibacteria group bacterium]|nr:hypothetical protein [Patescibacteria group bacterium]MBU1906678.1 hypothetical protein [Patescibacteria group bacterium]